jgi:HEAT repeat protein
MFTLPVVLAVTLSTQDPAAAAMLRAGRALPGLTAQVQAAAAGVARLDASAAQLADLASLAQLATLADFSSLGSLGSLRDLATLADLASLGTTLADVPPTAWADDDPGDSLYRAGRRLLNRGRFTEAADAFGELIRRFPRSDYTADAYYWQAFALYKTNDADNYRIARRVLETQRAKYPRAATTGDAQSLYARIQGELARQGDSDAAQWVRVHAVAPPAPPTPPTTPSPPAPPTPPAPPSSGSRRPTQGCASDDDDDPRVAALNALLQMDADAAVPILKQVLARRDPCSVVLRRKAVFIISQKRTSETEDILLASARTDPDAEVREQAVFWLSQVGSERAVNALDSILRSSPDPELQKKALFALSQIQGPRAGQILRDFAQRGDAPGEVREQAIFWLGQQSTPENAAFLRDLYAHLTDDDLRDKVIFSLSQMRSEENTRWLLDLAQNEREPIEMRKKALFWAGQTGADLTDLAALYDRTSNEEMKEQLIFVYSQRHEPAAVEKLIDIAKHDGNPELRKKAVFWLGQSHDPRARQALLDIINQ